MLRYLKLMLQLLMSPQRGWEDVEADGVSPRGVLMYGLLPLAGVAALSVASGFFYEHHPVFGDLLVRAVVTFSRYVLTYFIAVALLGYVLPRLTSDGLADRQRIELFAAFTAGMMTLIGILENLLPMELPLLQFLPLYVVVVIIQSRFFLNVDERNLFRYAAFAIIGIILPVFIIDRLLLPA